MRKGHVVVAMSGGVDSAVTAYLLREQGYEVTALFMNNGVYQEAAGQGRKARSCCSAHDSRDAAACARQLGIAYHELNFKRSFARIIDHFTAEYQQGRTPNPCIDCNQQLKFGKLITYARGMGADWVATGHYAKLDGDDGGRRFLRRSRDVAKDQTYVLFSLSQTQLGRMKLPLGELTKPEVRQIATEAGLPVRDKPESQDICFVPEGNYREVLAKRGVAERPGEIRDTSGAVVGEHRGIHQFTIGQRRGLGVAVGAPRYVVELDPETNQVVIGDRDALLQSTLTASRVCWMRHAGLAPDQELRALGQIRYHHTPAAATIRGLAGGQVALTFDEPQSAITPGQALCLYDADGAVLGGGWID